MSTIAKLSLKEYEQIVATGVFDGKNHRRLELIRGELREMSPIGPVHADLVAWLTNWSIRSTSADEIQIRVQSPIARGRRRLCAGTGHRLGPIEPFSVGPSNACRRFAADRGCRLKSRIRSRRKSRTLRGGWHCRLLDRERDRAHGRNSPRPSGNPVPGCPTIRHRRYHRSLSRSVGRFGHRVAFWTAILTRHIAHHARCAGPRCLTLAKMTSTVRKRVLEHGGGFKTPALFPVRQISQARSRARPWNSANADCHYYPSLQPGPAAKSKKNSPSA